MLYLTEILTTTNLILKTFKSAFNFKMFSEASPSPTNTAVSFVSYTDLKYIDMV